MTSRWLRFRSWRAPSLRARVTVATAVVAGAGLSLGAFIGLAGLDHAMRDNVQSTAEAVLDSYLTSLGGGQIGPSVPTSGEVTKFVYLRADGREMDYEQYQSLLIDELNKVGSVTLPTIPDGAPSDTVVRVSSGVIQMAVALPQANQARVIATTVDSVLVGIPVTIGSQTVTVAVSAPLGVVTSTMVTLRAASAVALPLLVAGVALLCWWVVGRALRPVDQITAQVGAITSRNLHERIPDAPGSDEIARLRTTMNTMLARLDVSQGAQRRFVSDASHELRSPITASLVTLEVAAAHPSDADWTAVGGTVAAELRRLAALVDDLLALARLDEVEPGATERTVDLEELVLEEAARPHPVPVRVRVDAPARVHGDPRSLARAIRNLVDNAARHAATEVVVTVGGMDSATVDVADDGPGIPKEHRAVIFDRFSRLDESRDRSSGGAGLGLAITRGIVEHHGGTVACRANPSGGAIFTVTLPITAR